VTPIHCPSSLHPDRRQPGPLSVGLGHAQPVAVAICFAFVFQFYYLLPEFGTRCSTLVSMESNGSWRFIERRFDSAGVNAGESLYSFAVGEDR